MRDTAFIHLRPRLSRARRVLFWLAAGAAGIVLGFVLLIRQSIERAHEDFETRARIAHRLLSQRAVQHEAVLTTLSLMQPALNARLPAVYPQVLQVWRRDAGQDWPAPPQLQGALRQAERAATGVALALADLPHGRFWIVAPALDRTAASGASYAFEISLPLTVPWDEWPFARANGKGGSVDSSVRLEHGGARWTIHAADRGQGAMQLRRFEFRKQLASASQPFDIVAERAYLPADLPWLAMLSWALAWAAALAGLAHVLRQYRARRRAEELLRLDQVSRLNALGALAAGLAHELNQPLTAVLAGTQAATRLLADEPADLAPAQEAMKQVATQARRAAEVVARLRRTIERPDTGARVRVDLAAAARDVLELLEQDCRRRGVKVQLSADVPVLAQADPVALDQILHNLVGNALHALEPVSAPELRVAVTVGAAGTARLSIRDNGPGVAPELAARLFEPFVSGRPGGLGLGLSLCATLAEEMGGRLRYREAAPGAEFILELPSELAVTKPAEGSSP